MDPTSPIGVFDSGVGGLSILSSLHQLLPHEHLIYFADSAHAPYGPKGDAFIRERSAAIMSYFRARKAKAVVVACNTATAAAIVDMRRDDSIPIIGVEPAVKPSAEQSTTGIVGVMATTGTISSDKFISLKNRFTHQAEIITRACPGLVELIEAPEFDEAAILRLLATFIDPIVDKGADTLVMGCTHYSLIKAQIQQVAGQAVRIIDAGDAVAKESLRRLLEIGAAAPEDQAGSLEFLSTGDAAVQELLISRYWGSEVQVIHVDE